MLSSTWLSLVAIDNLSASNLFPSICIMLMLPMPNIRSQASQAQGEYKMAWWCEQPSLHITPPLTDMP